MHYSRYRLTASVAYVTTLMYASTNDQWAQPACLLFSSSKSKPRVSLVQFIYVALYATLGYNLMYTVGYKKRGPLLLFTSLPPIFKIFALSHSADNLQLSYSIFHRMVNAYLH